MRKRARISQPSDKGLQDAGMPQAATGLNSLPLALQQLVMMTAGRGGRGAFASCRALRDAFSDAVHCPNLFCRYCLSTWSPRHAIIQALKRLPEVHRGLPTHEREQRSRIVLRALVEAGAQVSASQIPFAIRAGGAGLVEELLRQIEAKGRLRDCVAACCAVLASCGVRRGVNQDVVRVLVRAVTSTAGVNIHWYTFQTALVNASCAGNASALAGLLEAQPPQRCITAALHLAAKTPHAACVEQLVAAEAVVSPGMLRSAACGAHPDVMRPMLEALRRNGAWDRGVATKVFHMAAAYHSWWQPAAPVKDWVRRGEALRMLVAEFGADPSAQGSECLAAMDAWRKSASGWGELLLLMGADADAALLSLCSGVAAGAEDEPLDLARHQAVEALAGLLELGAESAEGAARAVQAAMQRGRLDLAWLLLGSGVVPASACEGLLRRALLGQQQQPQADEEVALGADGAGQQHGRRWNWVRALANAGCARRDDVERALEAACRRGDAEATEELASLCIAGTDSCVAAFWLAVDGGHELCTRALQALGAVGQDVVREAERVRAAEKTLRRLRGGCGGGGEGAAVGL